MYLNKKEKHKLDANRQILLILILFIYHEHRTPVLSSSALCSTDCNRHRSCVVVSRRCSYGLCVTSEIVKVDLYLQMLSSITCL